jgi:hypothetical protein
MIHCPADDPSASWSFIVQSPLLIEACKNLFSIQRYLVWSSISTESIIWITMKMEQ